MDASQWHELASALPIDLPDLFEALTTRDEDQRSEAISELAAAFDGLVLPSEAVLEAHSALTELVRENAARPAGSKSIAGVSAPFAAGKTTAITQWAYKVHRDAVAGAVNIARPTWQPEPGVNARLVPVVYLSLISSAGVKELNAQILTFLGYPGEGIARVTAGRVSTALRRHRVKLLIFDDAHMLRVNNRSSRFVLDYLKTLNSELGFLHGTMLFVGAELETSPVFEDPQIRARLRVLDLRPTEIITDEGRRRWQRFLKDAEQLLLPHLRGTKEGVLSSEHAAFIWHRSQGYPGDATRLMCQGVINTLRRGGRTITRADLARVTLSARAHDEQAELERRRWKGRGHASTSDL